jgi:hypothetical protein
MSPAVYATAGRSAVWQTGGLDEGPVTACGVFRDIVPRRPGIPIEYFVGAGMNEKRLLLEAQVIDIWGFSVPICAIVVYRLGVRPFCATSDGSLSTHKPSPLALFSPHSL